MHSKTAISSLFVFLTALLITPTGNAAESLKIEMGQIPMPPPGVPLMAGFAIITNSTTDDIVVVSADSASFEKVEIHQTTIENEVARMRKLKELVVPASATVELKHGAIHLMLKKPLDELRPGQHVLVDLNLVSGKTVTAQFEVMEGMHKQHKKSRAKKMDQGHDSKKTDHASKDGHEGRKLNN